MFAKRLALVWLLSFASIARAQVDGGAPNDGGSGVAPNDGGVGVAPDGGVVEPSSPSAELKVARDEFEFGSYERVVGRLRPIVEALELARELPQKADRLEALRVYGIACTLTGRRTAAEGAFLLLLREEPSMRLDPALVRPEAVAFFDEVRARHRAELLAAYRKNRRPYYWALDVIPLAGQLQNRQWKKAIVFGAVELALLATNVTTGALLGHYAGPNDDFRGHVTAFGPLRDVNWISFGLLLGVGAAGIIDSFVVGARRRERDRQAEARIGF
ncbi:MAG TPA: hypothetical protein VGL86_21875 [Polyangia bacterium]|jgi:hypothetical protein